MLGPLAEKLFGLHVDLTFIQLLRLFLRNWWSGIFRGLIVVGPSIKTVNTYGGNLVHFHKADHFDFLAMEHIEWGDFRNTLLLNESGRMPG